MPSTEIRSAKNRTRNCSNSFVNLNMPFMARVQMRGPLWTLTSATSRPTASCSWMQLVTAFGHQDFQVEARQTHWVLLKPWHQQHSEHFQMDLVHFEVFEIFRTWHGFAGVGRYALAGAPVPALFSSPVVPFAALHLHRETATSAPRFVRQSQIPKSSFHVHLGYLGKAACFPLPISVVLWWTAVHRAA